MLSRPQDFAAIQEDGTPRSHPLLAARFLRTDLETTRFGLSTGRKLGGAVVRNRVRRRLREALRAMAPSFRPGWDVLIIARPAIVGGRPRRDGRRRCGGSSSEGGVLGRTDDVKTSGSGCIKLYRIVFFWLPSSCRFEPTCSRYTEQAIEKYGLFRGAGWAPSRIARCHPVEPGRL